MRCKRRDGRCIRGVIVCFIVLEVYGMGGDYDICLYAHGFYFGNVNMNFLLAVYMDSCCCAVSFSHYAMLHLTKTMQNMMVSYKIESKRLEMHDRSFPMYMVSPNHSPLRKKKGITLVPTVFPHIVYIYTSLPTLLGGVSGVTLPLNDDNDADSGGGAARKLG